MAGRRETAARSARGSTNPSTRPIAAGFAALHTSRSLARPWLRRSVGPTIARSNHRTIARYDRLDRSGAPEVGVSRPLSDTLLPVYGSRLPAYAPPQWREPALSGTLLPAYGSRLPAYAPPQWREPASLWHTASGLRLTRHGLRGTWSRCEQHLSFRPPTIAPSNHRTIAPTHRPPADSKGRHRSARSAIMLPSGRP
jgi:hypothetical protein